VYSNAVRTRSVSTAVQSAILNLSEKLLSGMAISVSFFLQISNGSMVHLQFFPEVEEMIREWKRYPGLSVVLRQEPEKSS